MLKTFFRGQPALGDPFISMFRGLTLDSSGNVLFATDPFGNGSFVMRLDPNGNSLPGYGGTAVLAFDSITGLAMDPAGPLYLTDESARIKQGTADGAFATIFNRELDQYRGNQQGTFAPVVSGILAISPAVDSHGNLYVTDRNLNIVRKLAAGTCHPVAQPVIAGIAPSPGKDIGFPVYAPGELISIYGAGLGPSEGIGPVLDETGFVPENLGGVRVLFEGIPGRVLYAGAGQVNAIIPFTMYARTTVRVAVEYNGVASDVFVLNMVESAPRLFARVVGTNQTATIVVNPDGSLNALDNPAPAGSWVTVYGTGFGRTLPEGTDGHLAASPLPAPVLPVTVTQGFSILYAGAAPGLVEGVFQINLQLPMTPISSSVALKQGSGSTTVYIVSK